MSVFPLFIELKGKKCVVVGAGKVAQRKIEILLQFGANITVVSPQISEEIEKLKWENRIVVIKKKYSCDDLEDAYLVIGATSDRKVNEQIYEDALRNNLFVNIVDNPDLCSFIFPSVVKRDELVIGISTSGGYPALSKRVRQKVEESVPEFYGKMLQTLKMCRERAKIEIKQPEKRKEILNVLLDELLFYEESITEAQLKVRIEKIFGEYGNEKSD